MRYSTSTYLGFSRCTELAKLGVDNTRPALAVGAKRCKGNSNQSLDPPSTTAPGVLEEIRQLTAAVSTMSKSLQIVTKRLERIDNQDHRRDQQHSPSTSIPTVSSNAPQPHEKGGQDGLG
jgi:hypothetical protein